MAKRIEKLMRFEATEGMHMERDIVRIPGNNVEDKLDEVVEAVNTLTEQVEDIVETMRYEKGLVPTQVEPEELPRWETTEEALAREVEPDKKSGVPESGIPPLPEYTKHQAIPDSLLEEYKKLSERALEPDTEQWQPLAGHGYWAVKANGVVEYRKHDSEADGEWFEFGNCFRYQEEAEAAAEKIRNLLRGRS